LVIFIPVQSVSEDPLAADLEKYKNPIENYLKDFFLSLKEELSGVNRWGNDLADRLLEFSLQGKMIRGTLTIASCEMLSGTVPSWIIPVASAFELIHSSLLIHDDIMDRDLYRRGEKTIFSQYIEVGKEEIRGDSSHFGKSLGICAGDIGFFLAQKILSAAELNPKTRNRIFEFWANELVRVGLAQMQDIYFSISRRQVEEREILNLYRFKTARYTFSIPLVTGAIAAQADEKTISLLEKLGEHMGIIFQIKDDELGLFGTEEETGKPVGTDIREKKKTLYAFYLFKMAPESAGETLRALYEKKDITGSDLQKIKDIVTKSGVYKMIEKKVLAHKNEALKLIDSLGTEEKWKKILRGLISYIHERKR